MPEYTLPSRHGDSVITLPEEGAGLYRGVGEQVWRRPLAWEDTIIMPLSRTDLNIMLPAILKGEAERGATAMELMRILHSIGKRYAPLNKEILGIPLPTLWELASKVEDELAREYIKKLARIHPIDFARVLQGLAATAVTEQDWINAVALRDTYRELLNKPKFRQIMEPGIISEIWTTEPIAGEQVIFGPKDIEPEWKEGEFWGRQQAQPWEEQQIRSMFKHDPARMEKNIKELYGENRASHLATTYLKSHHGQYGEHRSPKRELARDPRVAQQLLDYVDDLIAKGISGEEMHHIMHVQALEHMGQLDMKSKVAVYTQMGGDIVDAKRVWDKAKDLNIKFPKGLKSMAPFMIALPFMTDADADEQMAAMGGAVGMTLSDPEVEKLINERFDLEMKGKKRTPAEATRLKEINTTLRPYLDKAWADWKRMTKEDPDLLWKTQDMIRDFEERAKIRSSIPERLEAPVPKTPAERKAFNDFVRDSGFIDKVLKRGKGRGLALLAGLGLLSDEETREEGTLLAGAGMMGGPPDDGIQVWRAVEGRPAEPHIIRPRNPLVIPDDQFEELRRLARQGLVELPEGPLTYPVADRIIAEYYLPQGYDFLIYEKRNVGSSENLREYADLEGQRHYAATQEHAELYGVTNRQRTGQGQLRPPEQPPRERPPLGQNPFAEEADVIDFPFERTTAGKEQAEREAREAAARRLQERYGQAYRQQIDDEVEDLWRRSMFGVVDPETGEIRSAMPEMIPVEEAAEARTPRPDETVVTGGERRRVLNPDMSESQRQFRDRLMAAREKPYQEEYRKGIAELVRRGDPRVQKGGVIYESADADEKRFIDKAQRETAEETDRMMKEVKGRVGPKVARGGLSALTWADAITTGLDIGSDAPAREAMEMLGSLITGAPDPTAGPLTNTEIEAIEGVLGKMPQFGKMVQTEEEAEEGEQFREWEALGGGERAPKIVTKTSEPWGPMGMLPAHQERLSANRLRKYKDYIGGDYRWDASKKDWVPRTELGGDDFERETWRNIRRSLGEKVPEAQVELGADWELKLEPEESWDDYEVLPKSKDPTILEPTIEAVPPPKKEGEHRLRNIWGEWIGDVK